MFQGIFGDTTLVRSGAYTRVTKTRYTQAEILTILTFILGKIRDDPLIRLILYLYLYDILQL